MAGIRSAFALLLLLLVLGSCSSGSGDSTDPLNNDPPPPHDVSIVVGAEDEGSNAFSPSPVVISLGSQTTVTWYNGDSSDGGTQHMLKSDDGSTFESNVLQPGSVFRVTFSAPGTYDYHCEFHDEMQGTVTVNP